MELYEYDKDIFERKNILTEKPDIMKELLPILAKGNRFVN